MSSGEKAKTPATFEERNPFDISRRSHTEVAGEIAKRMAAWKQARSRSHPAPATAPSGAEKRPQVSAPVQPAPAPKRAERPAVQTAPTTVPAAAAPEQRPAASNASGRARVPYFATFSLQRAMPPAPSPRKPDASPQDPTDSAQSLQAAAEPTQVEHEIAPAAEAPRVETTAGEKAMEIDALSAGAAAPVEAQRLDTEANTPSAAECGADTIEPVAVEEFASAPVVSAESRSVPKPAAEGPTAEEVLLDSAHETGDTRAEAPAVTEIEPAAPAEAPGDIEDRRAMARNMRARWIAAHDLDSPHLEESSRSEQGAPTPSKPEARADEAAPENTPAIPSAEMSDQASGRKEPRFDAPMARSDSTEPISAETVASTLDEAPRAERDVDVAIERLGSVAESAAARQPEMPAAIEIAALDRLSGRKEPTFDAPMAPRDSIDPKSAVPAAARLRDEAPKSAAPIEAPDELSGRKEPTFAKPAASKKAKEAPTVAAGLLKGESGIKLRAIETRIEARRIEAVRTEPLVPPVARPDIPHIERDEWDVPSPISTNRAAERHGWAIGLGAILLIVGITAPAAIWQHDRQASPTTQDQVALDPALLPPQQKAGGSTPAPAEKTASTVPGAPATAAATPATGQPSEPAAPQAPAASAPQLTDAQVATPPAPAAQPGTDDAAQAQQGPTKQAALDAVQDGGQLDKVPVTSPRLSPKPQPKPQSTPLHLASRAPMPFATASGQPSGSEMVAKPFVPESGSDHFLRAPTTGVATVPIDDGSGAHGASVVVRPTLMAQLKPKPAGAKPFKGAPQISSPKPADQSLDQMFQTLVDTLSEGKPVNPATKPLPPSNRK